VSVTRCYYRREARVFTLRDELERAPYARGAMLRARRESARRAFISIDARLSASTSVTPRAARCFARYAYALICVSVRDRGLHMSRASGGAKDTDARIGLLMSFSIDIFVIFFFFFFFFLPFVSL